MEKVERTEAEWREMLSPTEYAVLRQAATERAFTGEYTDTETVGVYRCKACGAELFRSDAKFHSGCGWPSFYQPTSDDAVTLIEDRSHGMIRVEARCARCDSHLGHVFTGDPMTVSGMLVLSLMTGLGFVGFLDDFLKLFMRRSLGLRSRAKLLGQVIVGVVFAVLAIRFPDGYGLTRPRSTCRSTPTSVSPWARSYSSSGCCSWSPPPPTG